MIGANGSLMGYGGGLERKRVLLELEEAGVGPEMAVPASLCQRVGLAVGSGAGEAEGSTVDKGDGTAVGVPLTSALTLQSRRSTSSRVWMDCSRRTMSSSCWRFTAVIAGPTSLKIVEMA